MIVGYHRKIGKHVLNTVDMKKQPCVECPNLDFSLSLFWTNYAIKGLSHNIIDFHMCILLYLFTVLTHLFSIYIY